MSIRLQDLPKVLKADAARIEEAIRHAIGKTAEKAVTPIKKRVPVAFGELRDSIMPLDIGSAPKTGVEAPHAGAVEIGSLPHTPDWERLLAWVKLRGMQGLTAGGRLKTRFPRSAGPTTPRQARRLASMFKSLEVHGKRGVGRHLPVDAAEQVAKAISKGIEEHGTKPHWFVRDSLPDIKEILSTEIRKDLNRVSAKRS